MKILSFGNFTGVGWDGSRTDENHIADTLEDLGHEVIRWQREYTDVETPVNFQPDFVLVAQWEGYEHRISTLKTRYTPIVYWAFDYQADGQEWHERLVRESNLYLSKRIADSKYPNWQWLSQDFAPEFLDRYDPTELVEKDIDVLFTGSYLPWADERNKLLRIVANNFNLVVHSVNEWPEDIIPKGSQPPIMDEGLPKLYARAKIVLSIDHTLESGYWSDRNAQAMACGAFVLFRYVPLSESVFRNNIAYFYSIDDCCDKLVNLLRTDITPIREEYAQKGYEYAQANLKVKNRVMDLLTIVGSIL
jgi:hypothetical protein